jgi:hypothetical protein
MKLLILLAELRVTHASDLHKLSTEALESKASVDAMAEVGERRLNQERLKHQLELEKGTRANDMHA